MKKYIIIVTMIFLNTIIVSAQETSGIKFEKGLRWSDILEKAAKERKYIFVDCYATWCGPCKEMDERVYPLKEVGDAYNNNYISVKVQMDKTPSDDDFIKLLYGKAQAFLRDYYITAYPTFLFFNPDGTIVHKVTGTMTPKDFIQLAADSKNPDKQYYRILKNFQPNTLDTAEEKGLARLFIYSDKELAGKIAVDYLTRVPKDELNLKDNGLLMVQFQNNEQVLDVAIDYLNNHKKEDNLNFILALRYKPAIKVIATNYINGLTKDELGKEKNLKFIPSFIDEPKIRQIVDNYVNYLPEDSLFAPKIIRFLNLVTTSPTDRGFDVCFHNADKINNVMKSKDYAQDLVSYVINKAEFTPKFVIDTGSKTEPDFKNLYEIVAEKYNNYYAQRISIDAKLAWFGFLVSKKKEDKYWPELIQAEINSMKEHRRDTLLSASVSVNNICWYVFFFHSDDKAQLSEAIRWMKNVTNKNPSRDDFFDTYAHLFYKTGKIQEALKWENKAKQAAMLKKDEQLVELYNKTIKKMKKGEKLWLEKET